MAFKRLKSLFFVASVAIVSPSAVMSGDIIRSAHAEENKRLGYDDIIAGLKREVPALRDDLQRLADIAGDANTDRTGPQTEVLAQRVNRVQDLLQQEKDTPFSDRNFILHAAIEAGEGDVRRQLGLLMDRAIGKMMSTPELKNAHLREVTRLWRIKSVIVPRRAASPPSPDA